MSSVKKNQSVSLKQAGNDQLPPAIAIQGYEGSFHQEAARQFFGQDVEVVPCATFRELIKKCGNKKETDGAVMAIENSIAGSILPNYNLLQKSNLTIIGEVYLQIGQHLLVNPGVSLTDIKEVQSHPMALLQCIDFLEKYPHWKLVETEDTALSAKHIHQHRSKHAAAIASKLAADLFQLNVLAPNIQTAKNNYTRFLVLKREKETFDVEAADKASVYFETDHSKGSLSKVLTLIAKEDINLSKLQSMPIPGSDFMYGFYADMEIVDRVNLERIMNQIQGLTRTFKILGVYKNGKTPIKK